VERAISLVERRERDRGRERELPSAETAEGCKVTGSRYVGVPHNTKQNMRDFTFSSEVVKNRLPVVLCFYLQVLLTSEVGAMAKIVQDLESQLARAQEENAGLSKSLEELDDQHQDAVGL
jgi:hypothetical protein